MTGTYALRRLAGAAVLPACIALSQACASPPSAAAHGKAVMIDFAAPTDGALPALLADGAQLVVIGSGEADIEAAFRAAAAAHPDAVSVHLGYDEAFSHRIMAGADVLLVPSRFEPCGLTQLYALRYGTLPLVRRVGGLADTVIDATAENIRAGTANGFTFDDASSRKLAARIGRACALYRDVAVWRQIQRHGMAQDFSWDDSAVRYEALYRSI